MREIGDAASLARLLASGVTPRAQAEINHLARRIFVAMSKSGIGEIGTSETVMAIRRRVEFSYTFDGGTLHPVE